MLSFGFRNEYQLETTLLATRSIRFGHQILKLAKCCFFATPRFFFKFHLTLTAYNDGLNHRNPYVSHIFGKLRTCSSTWSYPG